jgi:hypothetical protein
MGTVNAIHGVDDTLKNLAKNAVKSLSSVPTVTVGPLDSDADGLRVNWFLYRIDPSPAYRNMEPPRTGWKTSRGKPPLALQLHYLLTAFPGGGATDGDEEQFSHAAIASVMNALHANPVIGTDDPALSAQAKPLVEPLRITLESLDLEALSKLWTAASEKMRLSVGYEVSLITVDPFQSHEAGPPVRTRRISVAPSLGPRLVSVTPPRASAGVDVVVEADGLTGGARFTLAREDGDPVGTGDWPMTFVKEDGPRRLVLRIPQADLAPGARRLDVSLLENGLRVGGDSIGLTVVPAVTGPTQTVAVGDSVDLVTAHASPDVEVFLDGRRLSGTAYVSATKVNVTIPTDTPSGPTELSLRAGKVAGPPFQGLTVAP